MAFGDLANPEQEREPHRQIDEDRGESRLEAANARHSPLRTGVLVAGPAKAVRTIRDSSKCNDICEALDSIHKLRSQLAATRDHSRPWSTGASHGEQGHKEAGDDESCGQHSGEERGVLVA
jgi:hypothetical protein